MPLKANIRKSLWHHHKVKIINLFQLSLYLKNLLRKFIHPKGKWTCTTCTLHNDAYRTKCDACGTSAPGDKLKNKQSSWPIGYSKPSFVQKKKTKAPKSLASFGFGGVATKCIEKDDNDNEKSAPRLSNKQSKLCRDVAENHWTLSLSYPNETSERCPVKLNEIMARAYVYPTNMQVREYQMEAVRSSVFDRKVSSELLNYLLDHMTQHSIA